MRIMRLPSLTRHMVAAGSTLVLAATIAFVPADQPAPSAPGYPSWSDVQAAKSSVAATQAEVAVVKAALQMAQNASTAAAQAALAADAAARKAEADLSAATTRADTLASEAAVAEGRANAAKKAVGVMASTLYSSQGEGALLLQLVSSPDPDRLLERLSVLDGVTSAWEATAQDAVFALSAAASLRDQAAVAEAARSRLAAQAETAAADARDAADRAAAAVASAQQHTDTLYAQLAALQDSTAAVERKYEIGVRVAAQAAAEERAREAAAAAAAAAASGGSSGGGGYPSTDGVVVDPAGAQAYARGAIGAYGWGGDQFSCLVSLWNMESGWRANALNPSSGAYGIPQALPASKLSAAGPDWRTNGDTQIDWGLAYISNRYGTPCGAWNHEMSVYPHWY